jgi:membrane protease YdiL (CAAX protease family)
VLLLILYIMQATTAVKRDPKVRENVREQSEKVAGLMPQTRTEMVWFGGVSLTAGFCEEFLFRGYFIWALAPWLGWWGAAALSGLIFAFGHAYQGWNGVLSTGIAGGFFTLVVIFTGSLWPVIILHFLWDFAMGVITWQARVGSCELGEKL